MSVRMAGALLKLKTKDEIPEMRDERQKMQHEQVIYGIPPSKSNCYRVVTINGHGSLTKTDAMRKYERDFYLQCSAYRNKMIKTYFELYMDAFLPTQRQDLDNLLKGVLDCLQACKAIDNDRHCVRIVAEKYIDPVRPRIEFTIRKVDGITVSKTREPDLFGGL